MTKIKRLLKDINGLKLEDLLKMMAGYIEFESINTSGTEINISRIKIYNTVGQTDPFKKENVIVIIDFNIDEQDFYSLYIDTEQNIMFCSHGSEWEIFDDYEYKIEQKIEANKDEYILYEGINDKNKNRAFNIILGMMLINEYVFIKKTY